MYKLLIVDDEEIIIRGLKKVIDWESYGFLVVSTCNNGTCAMEYIKSNSVDAVMTDIRMAGIDGLELSRWIYSNYPNIKVVVLSGYSDFEFAQTAMKNGVCGYILKPSKKKDIFELFTKIKKELDDVKDNKNELEILKNREVILNLLNNNNTEDIQQANNWITRTKDRSLVFIIIKTNYNPYKLLKDDMNKFLNSIFSKANYSNRDKTNQILLQVKQNVIALLIKVENAEIENVVNLIYNRLKEDIEKVSSDIGFSLTADYSINDINMIYKRYEKLMGIIKNEVWMGRNVIITNDDLENETNDENINKQLELIPDLILSPVHNVKDNIITLFDLYKTKHVKIIRTVHRDVYILLVKIKEQMQKAGFVFFEKNNKIENIMILINSCELLIDIEEILLSIIEEVYIRIRTDENHEMKRILRDAIKLIDTKYYESLKLDNIAKSLSISKTYLCHIFKANYNTTIKKYLTKVRMEKAEKFLAETDLKIYEVADKVGYKNRRIFSQAFREMKLMTPKEYREKY